ncbi:MAG: carboxypeptidase-like regulatory domain-containing protein, partial [Desulfurococcaceae archaeon]
PIPISESVPVASLALLWYRFTPVDASALANVTIRADVNRPAPASAHTIGYYWEIGSFEGAFEAFVLAAIAIKSHALSREALQQLYDTVKMGASTIRENIAKFSGDVAVRLGLKVEAEGVDKAMQAATQRGISEVDAAQAMEGAVRRVVGDAVATAAERFESKKAAVEIARSFKQVYDEIFERAVRLGQIEIPESQGNVKYIITADQMRMLNLRLWEVLEDMGASVGLQPTEIKSFEGTILEIARRMEASWRAAGIASETEAVQNLATAVLAEAAWRAGIKADAATALANAVLKSSLATTALKASEEVLELGAIAVIPGVALKGAIYNELLSMGYPPDKASAAAEAMATHLSVRISETGELPIVTVGASSLDFLEIVKSTVVPLIAQQAVQWAIGGPGGALMGIATSLVFGAFKTIVGGIEDMLLREGRGGAMALAGVAFEYTLGSSRALLLTMNIPVVRLTAITPFSPAKSLSDWVFSSLDSYAKASGYARIDVINLGTEDPIEKLKSLGAGKVTGFAVAVMPVVWRPLPTWGRVALSYSGRVTIRSVQLNVIMRGAPSSASDLLGELRLLVPSGAESISHAPSSVSGSRAEFTLDRPVENLVLKLGPSWRFYTARLRVTLKGGFVVPLQRKGSDFYAEAEVPPGLPRLNVAKVRLVLPVDKFTLARLSVGTQEEAEAWRVELPFDKFTLAGSTGQLWVFEAPLGATAFVLGSNMARRVSVYVQVGAAPTGDTSIDMYFNGTLPISVLPTHAVIKVHSPADQNATVTLRATLYWNITKPVRDWQLFGERVRLANGTNTLTVDIYGAILEAYGIVNRSGVPGLVRFTATVYPEVDADPGNNVVTKSLLLNPSSLNLTKYGNLTVAALSALTGAAVPGARVALYGPVLREGVTDASGRVRFTDLPADVYRVNVSATGYLPASAAAAVEGGKETVVAVHLVPAGAQQLPLPPGSNYTRPPIVVNGTTYVPLMVKVQYKDGFPVQGANVTISTPTERWSALTGADGTVLRYLPNNTAVTVAVLWGSYSETRSLTLTKPTSLFFTVPSESGRLVPEVAVVLVAAPPNWGPVMPVLVIVVTNVAQNVTLEVGLLNETGRYPLLTQNVPLQPGTAPLSLVINATGLSFGVYRPYARIVKYQYDNATWNNEYVGKPVRMLPQITVAVSVTVEVADFRGLPVIYPGVTVLRVTVRVYSSLNVTAKVLGFSPRLRLNLTTVMPGSQPQKSMLLDKELAELRKGMVVTVNFTLPRCR